MSDEIDRALRDDRERAERVRWSAARRSRYAYRHPEVFLRSSGAPVPENEGMSKHLDVLESVLMMIRQRRMTDEQIDRYAQILARAEADALRR